MLRLAFDFIITWRETRTRPNAYFFLIVRHQVQVWKEGIGSWVLKEKIILIPIIMESY